MFKHKSSSFGACSRLLNDGVYPSTPKIPHRERTAPICRSRARVESERGWDTEKLREFSAERGMQWKFTTPASPHQNGRCAEALMKTPCKIALEKASGAQVLTHFELYTCLLEVANLVNHRPIGRIPDDPDDGSYLCPNDILLGRASSLYHKVLSEKPKIPVFEWNLFRRL